ncbi:efflux transporter outer membrane subunit [Acidithiobacillus sp. CV18-2]|uniref:Efflux transporter outer membrane subunit n=1 Tax=Igneacidithiobacillus copahuensis TaxID=2724909 RepID=A0AAE3CJQ0_9PROT|nr:efflux transporter outer membrane subunit [Igneacidithiobacillus copahuensis]MBU2755280.1 efflux transporter outer membrane subunit [Acidithiobacillus sp. CV18-3]MBU2758364.1 efflux transporter outer membrane subunit [Acidithiobacillus sp. BN09-2]MBU2778211.1 efflux transporter outer membrane subunit [Acidithiobacillus sp. CV18-2]MBU2796933.1 efflux transporter outer membrane subunit [Acidithiobacillus sp. VAN18-2]MBU2799084.1 efflux transporter outer membrane subunit [Acidithiobacillus sp.
MSSSLPSYRFLALLVPLALGLSACSFEPKLRVPHTPGDHIPYAAKGNPKNTVSATGPAGSAQEFVYGKALDEEWWKLFHSQKINELVQTGLKNSPTVAQAQAQLRQAQAVERVNASIFYPQVTGSLQATRAKASSAAFGGGKGGFRYSLVTGSLGVSYYPDIFGVNRLVYRNSKALVDYQRWELEAARLTLSGNIVTTAIDAAATRAQIAATQEIIAREKKLLQLTQLQYQAGAIDDNTVVTQASQLASQEAKLPPLQQQLTVYDHQLATLLGEFPGEARIPELQLDQLTLPEKIPVSLPSTLLKQRPDIQAALAQMKAANATVGEAKAQFFPTVQLSAAIGSTAAHPGLFFDPVSSIWSLVGSLSQPIFEGGKLRAQESEAKAAYEVTFQEYRTTVLDAFGQVANALRALQRDAETLRAQQTALDAARKSLHLSEVSYRSGASDYLTLLTSEIQYNSARIAVVQAESQRYQDTAALLVAIGGGWWHEPGKGAPELQKVSIPPVKPSGDPQ